VGLKMDFLNFTNTDGNSSSQQGLTTGTVMEVEPVNENSQVNTTVAGDVLVTSDGI
jgi:hypothetical protein